MMASLELGRANDRDDHANVHDDHVNVRGDRVRGRDDRGRVHVHGLDLYRTVVKSVEFQLITENYITER